MTENSELIKKIKRFTAKYGMAGLAYENLSPRWDPFFYSLNHVSTIVIGNEWLENVRQNNMSRECKDMITMAFTPMTKRILRTEGNTTSKDVYNAVGKYVKQLCSELGYDEVIYESPILKEELPDTLAYYLTEWALISKDVTSRISGLVMRPSDYDAWIWCSV